MNLLKDKLKQLDQYQEEKLLQRINIVEQLNQKNKYLKQFLKRMKCLNRYKFQILSILQKKNKAKKVDKILHKLI